MSEQNQLSSNLRPSPVALTIAGSDSGAGAGIQADLKTFAAHEVYGVSVLTVVTAQNTLGVTAFHPLPGALVTQQLDAIAADFYIGAAKTGAMGDSDIIERVTDFLRDSPIRLIVDPVMISKHGHRLIDEEAVATLVRVLPNIARLITPNLHEASALTGLPLAVDRASMLSTAEALARQGWQACVVKGGHLADDALDLFWDDGEELWLPGERIDTPHLHGTGCTFSAAITANLVRGLSLPEAVEAAKEYTAGAIRHGQLFGKGINPLNHFWRTDPTFGKAPSGAQAEPLPL